MSGVYDNEKSKDHIKPKHDDKRGGVGGHENETLDQLESGVVDDKVMRKRSRAEREEHKKLEDKLSQSNSNSGWKTDTSSDGGTRFKVTGRRLAIAGGVSGLAVGGGIGFLTFMAGPLEFIHMSQMMQGFHLSDNEDAGDSRSSRFIRSVLKKKPENGRLGSVATKYAQRWERRMSEKSGIRVAYNDSGRFVGYYADPNHPKAQRLLDDFRKDGIPVEADPSINIRAPDGSELKGGLFINASDSNFRSRRSMVKVGVKSAGVNSISSAIGFRALIGRAGIDMHPLNRLRRGVDDLRDYRTKVREKRAEEDRTGKAEPDADKVYDGKDTDGDGTNDLTDGQRTANQAGLEAFEDAKADPEAGKISVKAKLVGGAAAAVGVLCTVRGMSEDVGEYQNTNVILPLTRVGARFVSIGNQVAYGEGFNMEELAALHADLNDPALGSWMSAQSIQAKLGRPGGVPIPPAAKPTTDKNGILELVDQIFAAAGPAGDVICNPVTQLALGATDLINPVTLAKTAAGVAASAAGVNPEDMLVEWITEKMRGEEVDLSNAKGAELGNYIDTGNFLSSNNQFISMGARKLSNEEVAELNDYHNQIKQDELQQKSYFARMFDVGDVDSLASQTMLRNPNITRPQTAIANFVRKPLGVFKSLGNSLASLTTSRAYADAIPYDYGVPQYGFSLSELQDERFDDPFENAAIVEPQLNELNEKYGKCYGTKVVDNKLTFEAQPTYDKLNSGDDGFDACNDTSLISKRYRFYILDTITEHSLSCYEGEESSCSQLGMDGGGNSSQQSTAPTNGNLPAGTPQELAQKIVDSGKVTGDTRYMAQISNIAAGNTECKVNPTVLALILALSADFELHISSLNRFCTGVLTGSGTSSYHYRDGGGHAVDFDIIDGKSSQGRAAHDTALLKKALPLLPSGSGIGQSNCGGDTLDFPAGVTEFNDSCDHVHIQVPVQ